MIIIFGAMPFRPGLCRGSVLRTARSLDYARDKSPLLSLSREE